jgi:bifunctional non-homologous end joining protein LigD
MVGDEVFPALVRPMLAVPGELPPAAEDDAWAYEMKWDGVRAVAYLQGGTVRLMSRNDLDVTRSYPEVASAPDALAAEEAVLDGELVAFDAHGRPSFARLQERMHVRDVAVARRLAERVPVVYLVFDVLHLGGRSLLRTPYSERRAVLEGLDVDGDAWRMPPSFGGPGADVMAASREAGLEGVVAKRLSSPYEPGRRSGAWRKHKHRRAEWFVVTG